MMIFCNGYWNIRFKGYFKTQHPTCTEKYDFDRIDGADYRWVVFHRRPVRRWFLARNRCTLDTVLLDRFVQNLTGRILDWLDHKWSKEDGEKFRSANSGNSKVHSMHI